MSTYAIAEAIGKFTKSFKEVISERNKIEKNKLNFEKEKLAFEKEKFEFNKQQLEVLEVNESSKDNSNNLNNNINTEFACPHHWIFHSVCYDPCVEPSDFTRKEKYVCTWCGETKTEIIEDFFKR